MLKAIWRKLVPGAATAAAAITVATLSVSVVHADLLWFGLDAAIRVGVPAFLVGMLFFPVNEQTLASRIGFSLRTMFAAAVAGLAHRVLWISLLNGDQLPEYGFDASSVLQVLRQPSMLWFDGFDTTAYLAMSAVAGATVVAYAAQPMLKRFARRQRPTVASALSALDSKSIGAHAAIRQRS